MKTAIHIWFPILLLLTLPGLMACTHQGVATPMIDYITHYDSLLAHEGDTVHVQGTFFKYNGMPGFGPENAYYLPAILLDGDSVPNLFLHREMAVQELDSLDGKQVTFQGVFFMEERLLPGDPPWAARRTGSWMYDVTDLRIRGAE